MNGQAAGPGQVEWTARAVAWGRGRLTATGHGVALGALALAEAIVWALLMVVAVLSGCVIGLPLVAPSVLGVRRLAGLTRDLSAAWCGVPITAAYRPPPAALTAPGPGRTVARLPARLRWLLSDQATWRDLLWMVLNPCLGVVLAGGSAAMIIFGVFGLALPHGSTPIAGTLSHPWLGIGLAAAGFWSAPWLLRGYGELARWVLGPTRRAELTRQVGHLAQTRSDAIDAGAAEVRRIERDLHDGAQARLVSMGMTLDAAGQLLETNPAAARALLAEARDSSVKALGELRDLVRGIHPPVLADRGLPDAVRALALDLPLRVQCAGELRAGPRRRWSRPPTSRSASCWPTCPSTPGRARPGSTSGTRPGCCASA